MTAKGQLRTAFAFSALAHAALLGSLLRVARPDAVLVPVAVHWVGALQPSSAPVTGPAAQPPPPHGGRRPAARAPAAAALPAVDEAPVPAEASAEGESTAASVDGAPPSADAAPGAASGGGGLGPTVATGPPATATSSLLAELHRRLAAAARRCYPPAARRFRLQGEVPVHFCLDSNGVASALRLEGSTGSPLLDSSALECVVPGAAPLPAVQGCFLVPVHFGG